MGHHNRLSNALLVVDKDFGNCLGTVIPGASLWDDFPYPHSVELCVSPPVGHYRSIAVDMAASSGKEELDPRRLAPWKGTLIHIGGEEDALNSAFCDATPLAAKIAMLTRNSANGLPVDVQWLYTMGHVVAKRKSINFLLRHQQDPRVMLLKLLGPARALPDHCNFHRVPCKREDLCAADDGADVDKQSAPMLPVKYVVGYLEEELKAFIRPTEHWMCIYMETAEQLDYATTMLEQCGAMLSAHYSTSLNLNKRWKSSFLAPPAGLQDQVLKQAGPICSACERSEPPDGPKHKY